MSHSIAFAFQRICADWLPACRVLFYWLVVDSSKSQVSHLTFAQAPGRLGFHHLVLFLFFPYLLCIDYYYYLLLLNIIIIIGEIVLRYVLYFRNVLTVIDS